MIRISTLESAGIHLTADDFEGASRSMLDPNWEIRRVGREPHPEARDRGDSMF
jgi:hypothetical protein